MAYDQKLYLAKLLRLKCPKNCDNRCKDNSNFILQEGKFGEVRAVCSRCYSTVNIAPRFRFAHFNSRDHPTKSRRKGAAKYGEDLFDPLTAKNLRSGKVFDELS